MLNHSTNMQSKLFVSINRDYYNNNMYVRDNNKKYTNRQNNINLGLKQSYVIKTKKNEIYITNRNIR